MPATETKTKLGERRIRWPYYGWFLMAMPVLFFAGTGIAILVARSKFRDYGDGKDLAAVIVKVEPEPPRPVEADLPAYSCYAVAGQRDERDGGFGRSGNFLRPMSATEAFGQPGRLSVVVASDQAARVGNFSGLHVRIVNRSGERVSFSALDSQLYLVQEAVNDNGEWEAIEEPPRSTGPLYCAHSYHRVSLKPGQYWDLVAPCYGGSFRTKLRFRLDLGKSSDAALAQPGGKVIYSNEFDGSIQPEQFQRSNVR